MIIIGADIVPTESNVNNFMQGNLKDIIDKELMDLLNSADLRVFNLEVPLTNESDPIAKNGPNLMAPTSCISGLLELKIDLLTLGNNHINDQNEAGIISTVRTLKDAGISYIGVGKNLGEASKPFYYSIANRRIGIYACAEHEFSIVEKGHWGANPLDLIETFDHINQMKKECDYVIVLYHGGKEHYQYPSPNLQKVCRKLIEKGADLVICQHSHCIGCEEKYLDRVIVYGQGNFLFDMNKNECWKTSLLIEITEDFKVKYHPMIKQGSILCLAHNKNKDEILNDFISRSEEILIPGFIDQKYKDFAQKHLENYIFNIGEINRTFMYKVLNKILNGKIDNWRIKRYLKNARIKMLNYIECEAHRELLIEGLKTYAE